MKLVSWNVNGLRSVYGKGFLSWLERQGADVICLQEIKANRDVLDESYWSPAQYSSHWHSAEKKGYSGVLIYSKREPVSVQVGIGDSTIDSEGRVLAAEYKDFILINAYFPNSQRDHARLNYKLLFCEKVLQFINHYRDSGKNIVLCGDFNIAHKEIDLKNPKANENNAGFLPQERAWFDTLLEVGYVDTFREFDQSSDKYTWWSYRPTIRERNIGWRLDYFVCNAEFRGKLKGVQHLTNVMGSDHCPVVLELKN